MKKQIAILLAVGMVVAMAGTARAGLLAAWEFDPGDVFGSSVSATGGTAANTTGTLIDGADASSGVLDLDGSGDYLQFGDDVADLRGLSSITVAAWYSAVRSPISPAREI